MELRKAHFQWSTLKVYRQVLRGFSRFLPRPPALTTSEDVLRYLGDLAVPPSGGLRRPRFRLQSANPHRQSLDPGNRQSPIADRKSSQPVSASWLSVNISVLRTALDKLGGLSVTEGLRTPKRARRIPELLQPAEAARLIEAAPTLRDRLLFGFMYGCGLKVGEACGLKWSDVDLATGRLRVTFAAGLRRRRMEFPEALAPILKAGAAACDPGQYIFAGTAPAKPLTTRMAERILKGAVRTAGLPETVTCMTLRHSYAVERLRSGMTVRDLQERLGHQSIETTLEYLRCIPKEVVSPADSLRIGAIDLSPGPGTVGESMDVPALPVNPLALPIPAAMDQEPVPFSVQLRMRLTDRFLATRSSTLQTGPPR